MRREGDAAASLVFAHEHNTLHENGRVPDELAKFQQRNARLLVHPELAVEQPCPLCPRREMEDDYPPWLLDGGLEPKSVVCGGDGDRIQVACLVLGRQIARDDFPP